MLGAYSLPETSNPFAMNSGAGVAKSLLTLLAMVASAVAAGADGGGRGAARRRLALAGPAGRRWRTGWARRCSGAYLAGDVLDRRLPELLATVTPRR